MKDSYYLSRAYVEFGPFPAKEILDFQARGILKETDFILGEGAKSKWLHVSEWTAIHGAPVVKPAPVKAIAPTKEAPKPKVAKAATPKVAAAPKPMILPVKKTAAKKAK